MTVSPLWSGPSKGLVFTTSIARQITEILTGNAVEFTKQGHVGVCLEEVDKHHFAIIVEDTGVGIEEQDRELFFSDSYRVTPESPLRGSGLGLALVASLVEVLNGSIQLSSELGKGSFFKVTLPRLFAPQ